ncbi:MAG: 2-hydroxymuconate tautomerase [Peptostreptococcaceae bacterium]|nr:2-hydroxymuconate tautomerase [Peptostreptococcaceae bacterium]
MPVVQVEMMAGRTVDQKREMVKKVTEALVETVGCSKEAVTVIIREMETENYGRAGELVFHK